MPLREFPDSFGRIRKAWTPILKESASSRLLSYSNTK
jgi:hypothetical protein